MNTDMNKKDGCTNDILTVIKNLANTPFYNPQKQRLDIVRLIEEYESKVK